MPAGTWHTEDLPKAYNKEERRVGVDFRGCGKVFQGWEGMEI